MNNFFRESLYKSMLKLKSLSLVKKNSNSYLHILSTEWNIYFFGFFSSQKSYFWNNLCRGKKRKSNSKSFAINYLQLLRRECAACVGEAGVIGFVWFRAGFGHLRVQQKIHGFLLPDVRVFFDSLRVVGDDGVRLTVLRRVPCRVIAQSGNEMWMLRTSVARYVRAAAAGRIRTPTKAHQGNYSDRELFKAQNW